MVVPLHVNGSLSEEALKLLIAMIVFPIGTKLVQSNGHEVQAGVVGPVAWAKRATLVESGDTNHTASLIERTSANLLGDCLHRRDSSVRVNHVALKYGKVRIGSLHHIKDDIATSDRISVYRRDGEVRVAAPSLTRKIGGPDKRDIFFRIFGKQSLEAALHRLDCRATGRARNRVRVLGRASEISNQDRCRKVRRIIDRRLRSHAFTTIRLVRKGHIGRFFVVAAGHDDDGRLGSLARLHKDVRRGDGELAILTQDKRDQTEHEARAVDLHVGTDRLRRQNVRPDQRSQAE